MQMLRYEQRSKVLAKLTNARCEIEDALSIGTPAGRYDPDLVPKATREKLSAMIEELDRLLRQIEGSQ